MQFVIGGPEIPDNLLQAHEEGRVVFFCGAGISYPADLPDFKGLVERIYAFSGASLTESDIENTAFQQGYFDTTLNLLEHRLAGQRQGVRRALAKILTPNLGLRGATETHAALLRLAKNREGTLRLVTTNFDRLFHSAARRSKNPFESYVAPMLPIPKNSRWDGIVYLHGLLPEKPDDTALNRLVVTSGDFGLAYLTERWASRFVSELFRNYVVCFIGYSLNDPVLRYMMDALAADRMLGEVTPQAWAFAACEPGHEKIKTAEWEAKRVKPILYEVPIGAADHSRLHRTLQAWSDTYRDGVIGKERIVVSHAMAHPTASTREDDFVGRILWAISDKTGLPAKRFADFNPVPSLDWLLNAFTVDRFVHNDLIRFNVPAHEKVDTALQFSLVRRPAAYDRTPPMLLTLGGMASTQLDHVMWHVARWLTRHLDDPRLIIWISENGGRLHERWKWFVEIEMNRLASLERDGKVAELEEIRLSSPRAIPSALMRTLWRLVLGGRIKSARDDADLYVWTDRLKRDGMTPSLRFELRELLAPKVTLKKPFRWDDDAESVQAPTRIRQLVDWQIELASDHVRSAIKDLPEPEWNSVLPILLPDLQQLLHDALELLSELGAADDKNDSSIWDLPSIEDHWQNRGFHEWVSLIESTRDAWLATLERDRERAIRIAQGWFEYRYPTFKRLALFAASKTRDISPAQWVDWLTHSEAWWLWSPETQREVFRLLVLRGEDLSETDQARLEISVLAGPPRDMYLQNIEPDEWGRVVAYNVWLRLAKLRSAGLTLGPAADQAWVDLSKAHPRWNLAANNSDEFSHWTIGTGDPDYEGSREVDIAPKDLPGLIEWLSKPRPHSRPFYEDTWRDLCRTSFQLSLEALRFLAGKAIWPISRWQDAFYTWSEEPLILQSWEQAASLVTSLPDDLLRELVGGLTWWMKAASKSSDAHVNLLLNLCRRVLGTELETTEGVHIVRNGAKIFDPVSSAINHPFGHVTDVLINVLLKSNPNDNERIPDDLVSYFSALCDMDRHDLRHGRVILASRLITFYRVDKFWTEEHLLPGFNWQNPVEAKALWQGFLWSPRIYQPLLLALKPHFLECANRYGDLGEHRQQFAAFLTFAALGPLEGYTAGEFRGAIGLLPPDGLERSAQALVQALEGAADRREEYWRNRLQPFWKNIWPKSRQLATPKITESLARLTIASGSEFPIVLTAVQGWLQPVEHLDYLVRLLSESELALKYPNDALQLLDMLIDDQRWIGKHLDRCLNQIETVAPKLSQDPRYQKVKAFFRTKGM